MVKDPVYFAASLEGVWTKNGKDAGMAQDVMCLLKLYFWLNRSFKSETRKDLYKHIKMWKYMQ